MTGSTSGPPVFGGDAADAVRRALSESDERLRLAVDAAEIGSWDWNVETGEVDLSDRLLTIHGFSPGDFPRTYRAYLECIHPNDRELFGEAMVTAIQQQEELDLEYRILLPSGGMRWVAAKGRPRYNAQSELVSFVGMGIDITERKRTEEALRFLSRSSELLSMTLDYETVLERIADLVVPSLADWCSVYLVEADGSIRLVTLTHADPGLGEIAGKLKRYVPDAETSAPVVEVLRSGRSILQPRPASTPRWRPPRWMKSTCGSCASSIFDR